MFRKLDPWAGKLNTWLYLKVTPYVPFTALNTALWKLDKSALSILDVGCGKGRTARSLRKRGHSLVGIDTFYPCIVECRKTGQYSALVLGDVRSLPFKAKSFDVVWCLEVLEHQNKEEGLRLIKELETIGRRQVILSTPVGFYPRRQPDNLYEEHRSAWTQDELKQLGYRVYGHGHKIWRGKIEFDSRFSSFLKPFIFVLWVLPGPFVYFAPQWSSDMVAVKWLEDNK